MQVEHKHASLQTVSSLHAVLEYDTGSATEKQHRNRCHAKLVGGFNPFEKI